MSRVWGLMWAAMRWKGEREQGGVQGRQRIQGQEEAQIFLAVCDSVRMITFGYELQHTVRFEPMTFYSSQAYWLEQDLSPQGPHQHGWHHLSRRLTWEEGQQEQLWSLVPRRE